MPPASSDALTVGLSERARAPPRPAAALPPALLARHLLEELPVDKLRSAVSIVPTVTMRSCTFPAKGEVNGSSGTRRCRLSHADTHSQQAASAC